jgi:hypothetical protein
VHNPSDSEARAFHLSRIYREGWNAVRTLLDGRNAGIGDVHASKLNPYCAPDERERWGKGFQDALRSQVKPASRRGGSSWRPATKKFR